MLSVEDLERLIAVKRHEIEQEKACLGLSLPPANTPEQKDLKASDLEDTDHDTTEVKKRVSFTENKELKEHNGKEDEKEKDNDTSFKLKDNIPAGLERYIRRYIGLPGMLKAGEYSPNNPLIRGERTSGDVLVGLGEYERRRNTLRKLRQQQYREYLDEQAKKKQEAKEQAEKERREREEKERKQDEERERERRLEEEREKEKKLQREREADQRRASVCYVPTPKGDTKTGYRNKVDTGVQVGISRPLSVAVQTDDIELYRLSHSPTKSQITEAERELSPRTVVDSHDERPVQPAPWASTPWGEQERRRSYADYDECPLPMRKQTSRDKLMSDLRHTYMPSLFDADAIHMRNVQAEKDAAERRQFYQQELKNQILEQQRIREERKTREKMLEQAEMRRLEEQLRMLKVAQEREVGKHHDITAAMTQSATEYDKKRTALQKEIDFEQKKLLRATTQPSHAIVKRKTVTSHSDTNLNQKLPFYYPKIQEREENRKFEEKRQPFSTNIPDNSIFSPNYDVDSYLRRNLNPSKESLLSNRLSTVTSESNIDIENIGSKNGRGSRENLGSKDNLEKGSESEGCETNVVVEKALIHDRPKEKRKLEKPKYEPSFPRKNLDEIISIDETPIPVLRHSPKDDSGIEERPKISQGMKLVEDKWKVPAVQKNILKSLPNDEGRNVSILTQLGSIRRQLQLEQLKLDNMLSKNNDV